MIMYFPLYPPPRPNQMSPYQQPWQPWPSYHGCYNHMPPYYHGACPYSFHPHGVVPAPAAYYVPPPHYSVELPRYDYDKNHHHCCGCNHKELKQVDSKTGDIKDSPAESKANDYTHDHSVSVNQHPKQAQDEQGNQFPFRVLWLPSKNDLVDEQATVNNEEKHVVQKVIPVKQVNENEGKNTMVNSNSVDNGSRCRSSPKTSKLPPVCLRVDPLPRKKKPSRSPSPGKDGRSNDSPKSSQQQQNLANVPMGEAEEEEKKKSMSEHEAALIIQSVYRGFQVRKSQPLKKLRQIYQVRKMVYELRDRIQDLETSSSSIGLDGKKEVVIGETIMSLLLELDTIQGLHPFVREVRKSVSKELVGLQENLDSLTSVKSETPGEFSSKQATHPEDDVIQEKLDQAKHHEHKAQCENDDDAGACNTIGEMQLESHKDDAPTECDEAPELGEVKGTESQGVCNLEQQLETSSEGDGIQDKVDQASVICESQEVKAIELQEGCNTIGECDEALELCEVKAAESEGSCNSIGEPSHDEVLGLSENHDVELEDKKVQMLVNVDSTGYENGDDGNVEMEANGVEGRGVMVENERLRELMNEQLGVIRELTGRVKDLEKKLEKSNKKKKKIKVNKGRRHVVV